MQKIVQYPHTSLTKDTAPVMEHNMDEAIKLARRLTRIMKESNGIGLAANQIDEKLRVAVIDTGETKRTYINPIGRGLGFIYKDIEIEKFFK